MDGRRGELRLAVPEQVDCPLVDELAAADGVTVEETPLTDDDLGERYDCAVVPVGGGDAEPIEPTLPTLYVAEPAALSALLGARADAVTPEATVEEALARLRALAGSGAGADAPAVDRMSDGYVAVDGEWRVTRANDAGRSVLREALELDDGQLVGRQLCDSLTDAVEPSLRETCREVARTGAPATVETRFEPLDAWFSVHAYPDTDGVSLYFREISTEKGLQTGYRALLETAQTLLAATDPDEIATTVMETIVDELGYEHCVVRLVDGDTLRPAAMSEPVGGETATRPTYNRDEGLPGETLQRGEPIEVPDLDAAGVDIGIPDVRSTLTVPMGEQGTISVGATEPDGFSEVDTQLLEVLALVATAALERDDRLQLLGRYRAALERTNEMAFALDAGGNLTLATESLANRWGYDRDEVLGRNILEFASREFVESLSEQLQRGEDSMTIEATDEETNLGVPVEIQLSAITPGEPTAGVVGIVHDISALAETRADLEQEQDRFRYLFEQLPSPAVEVRLDSGEKRIERTNARFGELFETDGEQSEGRPLDAVVEAPTDRSRDEQMLTEGSTAERRGERLTTTGRRTFIIRTVPFSIGGERRLFRIYIDITEETRRQRQLEMLHRVLRHNLRNELTVIGGNAQSLATSAEREQHRALAEAIVDSADALENLSDTSAMIRQISTTTDSTTGDLRNLVDEVLESVARPTLEVTVDVPEGVTVVGRQYLGRALRELLENAIEFGESPVAVRATPDDATVDIAVSDSGDGVPEREQAVIAGGLSISQLDHSRGLGLWVVSYVAESLGGRLRFEDDGTTVVLADLPIE
ncbi:PAS domain-containing protein [Halosegnis longus]|uniref:PAS domain-containing protein n=1 Tax=Halosegnis longus TaxID=2216012 RepID=UPI00129EF330|nr:PAS domain-containing protein [Halosegnis longus]